MLSVAGLAVRHGGAAVYQFNRSGNAEVCTYTETVQLGYETVAIRGLDLRELVMSGTRRHKGEP